VDLEPIEVAGDPAVRGVLHAAAGPDALVLTHGAGGNMDAPLLIAVAGALVERGVSVLRCDLPYRQVRPSGGPSPAGAARDRQGLRAALAVLGRRMTGRLFLGGHSYGGRQASMLLAEDPTLAAALVLQSYPLHPPGQPDKLRTAHLSRLRTPTVFVHGTTDPFATPAELAQARTLIPARTTLVETTAGHDLGLTPRKRDPSLPPIIAAALLDLMAAT
jgi:predicted alpha/beta-hydrolase family hydrolase